MSPRFVLRQESDRLANRKVIVITIASIIVFGAAVAVAGLLLGPMRAGRDIGPAAPSAAPASMGSVEQTLILGPPRGIDTRREQRASLDRWGWVDRDAGIARIPVERAMDLVADGGAP
jgi:hypothetical protein